MRRVSKKREVDDKEVRISKGVNIWKYFEDSGAGMKEVVFEVIGRGGVLVRLSSTVLGLAIRHAKFVQHSCYRYRKPSD